MLSLSIANSYDALDFNTTRRRTSPLLLSGFNGMNNAFAQPEFPSDQMKSGYPGKATPNTTLRVRKTRGQAVSLCERKDADKDRRRNDFLRKVREAGDDQRWRSRRDQILREDYVSGRKQWEEEQAKSAPEMPMAPEDEEKEVRHDSWSGGTGEGIEIMDDILQHEDQELDTLIAQLERSGPTAMEVTETETTENYGSDDEEYVWLCMEAVSAIEAKDAVTDNTQKATPEYFQDMDMSCG